VTVREELINEIDRASDDVLQVLLSFLRQTRLSNAEPSMLTDLAEISSAGLTAQKHYPLRGMPLVIAEDFDEPMSDLWDALGT
jgi:MoxR-like ATPase